MSSEGWFGVLRGRVLGVGMLAVIASLGWSSRASAQIGGGFDELHARLGDQAPTGAGIGVGQVEALSGSNYAPGSGSFPGQVITLMSGPSGASGHANAVLSRLVQRAPGITQVWAWEALAFLQGGFLNFGGPPPLTPPSGVRLFSHSWIATGEDAATGNDVLRRFDFQILRDSTPACVGTNNGSAGTTPYLMSSQFNGLTVGHPDGAHADTPGGGRDGAGRMKPDLVVGGQTTSSNATPVVSALVALLLQTAHDDPVLSGNPNARLPQVIKAVTLAGVTHPGEWTNLPGTAGAERGRTSRPLDDRWGAGFANADRSHLVLTSGEQESSSAVPSAPTVQPSGWDFTSISSNTRRYWRFELAETANEVTIVATWPRIVSGTFGSWSLMNIDLILHRVQGTTLLPLTGDAGLPFFSSGNVVSESDVDNVELLVVRDLQPGEYVIEIFRELGASSTGVAVAWIMPEPKPQPCPADLDLDGMVSGSDLGQLLVAWGTTGPSGDLDLSGLVDGADLAMMLNAWGECP